MFKYYRNNPKYWDRQAFVNSVDLDQMSQTATSDQGLHGLPYIQQYFRYQQVVDWIMSNLWTSMVK